MGSSPVRAPELQLAVDQPSTAGHCNKLKKDTPHPKTKKKVQRDCRIGTVTTKSNPTSSGWATHELENNNTKEVGIYPRLWRFLVPGFPAWGSNKGTGNPQGIWLWRSVGFNYRTSTCLGEIDSSLGAHKPRPRGKEQWPHRRLTQTYLLVLGMHGSAVARRGERGTGSSSPGRDPLT